MYTGDFDPVGADGKGNHTHAFDAAARAHKVNLERAALDRRSFSGLRPLGSGCPESTDRRAPHGVQQGIQIRESSGQNTSARLRSRNRRPGLSDHLVFSLIYTLRAVDFFPELSGHYLCLASQNCWSG